MSQPAGPPPPAADPDDSGRPRNRPHRSGWYWLLLVPLVAVLYPPLYNRTDPELLGIPFFYWYQLAVIPVSMACTVAVHLATRPDRTREAEPQGGRS